MLNYSSELLNKTDIRVAIAQRLHKERLCANLTLDELAEKSGYSKPTVQRWEKGWKDGTGENVIPTLDQLIDLCSIYHCSPGYLLCEYDEKTRQSSDISREIGLSEKSIAIMQKYFSALIMDENNSGSSSTILSFINHFIESIEEYDMILFNRHLLAHKQDRLLNHPQYKQLIEGFKAVTDSGINTDQLNNQMYAQSMLQKEFVEDLWDYYSKNKFDMMTYDEKEYLVHETLRYLEVLSPHKLKQINFEFSESYLKIVRDFFSDYIARIESYRAFIARQRDKIEKLNNHNEG